MKTPPLNVRLDAEERARIEEIARVEGNTVSGVVRHCITIGCKAYAAKREAEAALALEF